MDEDETKMYGFNTGHDDGVPLPLKINDGVMVTYTFDVDLDPR